MYWLDKNSIPIKILDAQKQQNGSDCELFAIADLVEFCFNPDNLLQIKTSLRMHVCNFVECLVNGIFTKFPQNSSQTFDTTVLKHKI